MALAVTAPSPEEQRRREGVRLVVTLALALHDAKNGFQDKPGLDELLLLFHSGEHPREALLAGTALARKMGLPEKDVDNIAMAHSMHDIFQGLGGGTNERKSLEVGLLVLDAINEAFVDSATSTIEGLLAKLNEKFPSSHTREYFERFTGNMVEAIFRPTLEQLYENDEHLQQLTDALQSSEEPVFDQEDRDLTTECTYATIVKRLEKGGIVQALDDEAEAELPRQSSTAAKVVASADAWASAAGRNEPLDPAHPEGKRKSQGPLRSVLLLLESRLKRVNRLPEAKQFPSGEGPIGRDGRYNFERGPEGAERNQKWLEGQLAYYQNYVFPLTDAAAFFGEQQRDNTEVLRGYVNFHAVEIKRGRDSADVMNEICDKAREFAGTPPTFDPHLDLRPPDGGSPGFGPTPDGDPLDGPDLAAHGARNGTVAPAVEGKAGARKDLQQSRPPGPNGHPTDHSAISGPNGGPSSLALPTAGMVAANGRQHARSAVSRTPPGEPPSEALQSRPSATTPRRRRPKLTTSSHGVSPATARRVRRGDAPSTPSSPSVSTRMSAPGAAVPRTAIAGNRATPAQSSLAAPPTGRRRSIEAVTSRPEGVAASMETPRGRATPRSAEQPGRLLGPSVGRTGRPDTASPRRSNPGRTGPPAVGRPALGPGTGGAPGSPGT